METERKEGGSRKTDPQEGKQPHSTSKMVPKMLPLNPPSDGRELCSAPTVPEQEKMINVYMKNNP